MTRFGDRETGATSRGGSITAANNDSGFEFVHDRIGGRPFVNVEYSVGGAAVIVVEGRYEFDDGTLSAFREYDRVDTSDADSPNDDIIQLPWVSYDEVRISTDATGIDVEFIISGTRG
jgi:hypothetical protein